jgi:uncharacterized protein with PIN domain
MTKLFKFKKFSYCPKCGTSLRGHPLRERINTKVEYRQMINALECRCQNCRYAWHEFTKDDPKNKEE